jgi:TRAP-type C4-dicarboxylate transport system substrate-binding protein
MKKIAIISLLTAVFTVFLGVSFNALLAETITLKYAAQQPTDHPVCAFPHKLSEIIEKKSKGSVKIKLYPDKLLAGYSLDPIQSGISDIQELVPGMGRDLVPWIQVMEVPYFITTVNHFYKVADPRGPVVTEANKALEKHNLIIVGFFNYGTRVLTMNRPIYSPSDLNEAKVRVVPTKVWIESWKSFGATPIPMPATEMPTALLTGAIDGQENSWHEIPGKALWDVQKYIMETDHLMTISALWVNLKKWNSMNKEQQEALRDSVSEARVWYQEEFTENKMREYRKLVVDKGMTIIGPNEGLKREEFAERGKAVLERFENQWGKWPEVIAGMAE